MLYILLSDRVLGAVGQTPEAVTRMQSFKGAAFVAISSAILYVLLRRWMHQMQRAQESEREQHALLHAVVHNTTDAVYLVDLEGRFLLVNRPGEQLIGRSASEIMGRVDADFLPGSLAERIEAARRAAVESGAARTIEVDTGRPDSRYWLLTYSPFRLDDGRVGGAICVARDITGHRESEEESRRSEARLRLFLEQMPAVVWSADQNLTITSLRGAGLAPIGMQPDELVGRSLADFADAHDGAMTDLDAHRRALAGESAVFQVVARGHTFECHLEPHRGADGEITGVIGLAIDVTERARAEQLMDEQEALIRQAQKMEAVGRLAGGLAHDFNNLLTIITSSAEFLDASLGKDDPRHEDVAEIRRAGDRAAVLVRELLAFSSQQLLQPAILDLHDVLEDARQLLARTLTAHVQLRTQSRPGTCVVKADKRQLELALVNLAVNARDAMPRGGTLTIACTTVRLEHGRMLLDAGQEVAAGDYALITVRDTGHGMDASTRARIFEPFYSTKAQAIGSGLGLAVVYGVVAQSGGFIEVDSAPGEGAEFRIYLPLAQQPEVRPVTGEFGVPAHSTTVLVAEDEDAVRRLARRILEREGFTVIEARDGQEALELCASQPLRIDLVLSDVVMPRLGGRELVDHCLTLYPGCRALLMSGYTDDELVRRDVLDSRAAFLPKPFTPDALVRKVREALEAPVPS